MQKIAGSMSGIHEARWVIARSRDVLDAVWREHCAGNDWPEPSVDFSRQTVIGYFAGLRPSGGYSVDMALSDDGIRAIATVVTPAASDFVTHVMTAPYCLLIAPIQQSNPICVVEERARSA